MKQLQQALEIVFCNDGNIMVFDMSIPFKRKTMIDRDHYYKASYTRENVWVKGVDNEREAGLFYRWYVKGKRNGCIIKYRLD